MSSLRQTVTGEKSENSRSTRARQKRLIREEFAVAVIAINVKKLQFMHTVSGDRSKTAKIIKKGNVNHAH